MPRRWVVPFLFCGATMACGDRIDTSEPQAATANDGGPGNQPNNQPGPGSDTTAPPPADTGTTNTPPPDPGSTDTDAGPGCSAYSFSDAFLSGNGHEWSAQGAGWTVEGGGTITSEGHDVNNDTPGAFFVTSTGSTSALLERSLSNACDLRFDVRSTYTAAGSFTLARFEGPSNRLVVYVSGGKVTLLLDDVVQWTMPFPANETHTVSLSISKANGVEAALDPDPPSLLTPIPNAKVLTGNNPTSIRVGIEASNASPAVTLGMVSTSVVSSTP